MVKTTTTANKLQFKREKAKGQISGVGALKAGTANSIINVSIKPRFSSTFTMNIKALVLKSLTQELPEQSFDGWRWAHLNNIIWADPSYDKTGPIDILLADHYSEIIMERISKGKKNDPLAQQTELGWIILGNSGEDSSCSTKISMISQVDVENQLKLFWEIEEINPERALTTKEIECEAIFEKSHRRLEDGTYKVKIPFDNTKQMENKLGCSKKTAIARLLQVEKRLARDVELKKQYHDFMTEYIKLKHMKLVKRDELKRLQADEEYFLPHHPVLKQESTTTKLRVVFDASAKTNSGYSLNDIMLTGPTLQQNLTSIVMRWRKHKYVTQQILRKCFVK